MTSNVMSGDYELVLIGRNLHLTNPILAIDNNFHSKYVGAGGNFQRYQNAEVDELLDKLCLESDTAKQQEMMHEVLTALHDDVANIPLYWSAWSIAYNNSLQNVEYLSSSYYHIADFAW